MSSSPSGERSISTLTPRSRTSSTSAPKAALIQERLAERLGGLVPVRIMEPPYDAVPLQEALWWQPLHTHDAAHIWLRETAARVGEAVNADRPTISSPPA